MSNPQVTITLGRSGQKVVKRPRAIGVGSFADYYADDWLPENKRLRGDMKSSGYERSVASVGRNDLRLKLMRKRMTKQMQQDVEEQNKVKLCGSTSGTVRSPVALGRSLFRQLPPTKTTAELLPIGSLRRSYSSRTLDGLMPKSTDGVVRVRSSFSPPPPPPKNIDEFQGVKSFRQIDSSRTRQPTFNDAFQSSRQMALAPITMRTTLDAAEPAPKLPPASSSGIQSAYFADRTLSVSSLLHSLGLGKYAIHFRAEEVDMAVLKQMGDRDLKELGIPMGPRKKILIALLSLSRQQQPKR